MSKITSKINIYLLVFIVILLVIITFLIAKKAYAPIANNSNDNKNTVSKNEILGNKEDLVSFSVDLGNTVTGLLTVVGSVQGGYFFEGNILVNILDVNKKLLRASHGNAKSDWMTNDPVGFDAVLDFTKLPSGLAYIEIHNDNASGLPENDKSIFIPIIIK